MYNTQVYIRLFSKLIYIYIYIYVYIYMSQGGSERSYVRLPGLRDEPYQALCEAPVLTHAPCLHHFLSLSLYVPSPHLPPFPLLPPYLLLSYLLYLFICSEKGWSVLTDLSYMRINIYYIMANQKLCISIYLYICIYINIYIYIYIYITSGNLDLHLRFYGNLDLHLRFCCILCNKYSQGQDAHHKKGVCPSSIRVSYTS
jgi:hypothetical protein